MEDKNTITLKELADYLIDRTLIDPWGEKLYGGIEFLFRDGEIYYYYLNKGMQILKRR